MCRAQPCIKNVHVLQIITEYIAQIGSILFQRGVSKRWYGAVTEASASLTVLRVLSYMSFAMLAEIASLTPPQREPRDVASVAGLSSLRALTSLSLSHSNVVNAGIAGLQNMLR
jgi:hypothetical protein